MSVTRPEPSRQPRDPKRTHSWTHNFSVPPLVVVLAALLGTWAATSEPAAAGIGVGLAVLTVLVPLLRGPRKE